MKPLTKRTHTDKIIQMALDGTLEEHGEDIEYKLVHLWGANGCPDGLTFDPRIYRECAIKLAAYACRDGLIIHGDPLFEEVTEGRQTDMIKWKKLYSSCGDLPHWMLKMLGCRNEKLVNRNDDGGEIPWVVGANLSRIIYSAQGSFIWSRQNKLRFPKNGDVVYLGYPEHVGVVLGRSGSLNVGEIPEAVILAEYGQVDDIKKGRTPTFKPAGKVRVHLVSRQYNGDILIGERSLFGWLDITTVGNDVPATVPKSFNIGTPYRDDNNPYIYPPEHGFGAEDDES